MRKTSQIVHQHSQWSKLRSQDRKAHAYEFADCNREASWGALGVNKNPTQVEFLKINGVKPNTEGTLMEKGPKAITTKAELLSSHVKAKQSLASESSEITEVKALLQGKGDSEHKSKKTKMHLHICRLRSQSGIGSWQTEQIDSRMLRNLCKRGHNKGRASTLDSGRHKIKR
ncbi:hypothetical protein FKM82_025699 [Ascaphus truei]